MDTRSLLCTGQLNASPYWISRGWGWGSFLLPLVPLFTDLTPSRFVNNLLPVGVLNNVSVKFVVC